MDKTPFVSAVIVAGGTGKRMGSAIPKQLHDLLGMPVVAWAVRAFDECSLVHSITIVHPEGDSEVERVVRRYSFRKVRSFVAGGPRRQDSVRRGLALVPQASTHVAVHDAARPCVSSEIIERTVQAAVRHGNAICAIPVKDTVKTVRQGEIIATPDRDTLWQAQTPQVFTKDILVAAHEAAALHGWQASDDAALVERLGETVVVVLGSDENLKITSPVDLAFAREILSGRLQERGGRP